jgi:hypothetical protein
MARSAAPITSGRTTASRRPPSQPRRLRVPVDGVGVELGGVDRQSGRLEVLGERRVTERLDAHPHLARAVPDRSAEDLDDAQFTAPQLRLVVLEAGQPQHGH